MQIRVLIRSKGSNRPLQLYFVDPKTGREVSKSAETSDRGEAERAAQRWEVELLAYRGENSDGWDYFRERFEDEHLSTLAKKTQSSYGTTLNHFERIIKPTSLAEITADTISRFQSTMMTEASTRKKKKKNSRRNISTVATYLVHLKSAFLWAKDTGRMIGAEIPVKIPRQPRRKFMRGRPLAESEYLAMLAACPAVCGAAALTWQRFLELLWLSGLRLGEALRLSWDSEPLIVMIDAKPYPQIHYYAEGQKNNRDDAIPITPEFSAWLKKTPPGKRHGLVSPLPVQHREASQTISDIGRQAGILVNDDGKAASAHDLRRAFGRRWAAKVRPLTLQKMMRHRDFATTLRYYVGLDCEDAGAEIWSGQDAAADNPVPTFVPKPKKKRPKAG